MKKFLLDLFKKLYGKDTITRTAFSYRLILMRNTHTVISTGGALPRSGEIP